MWKMTPNQKITAQDTLNTLRAIVIKISKGEHVRSDEHLMLASFANSAAHAAAAALDIRFNEYKQQPVTPEDWLDALRNAHMLLTR